MAIIPLYFLLTSLCRLSISAETGAIPRALAWSSKSYGPDGPWHAVTVEIGTPPQTIDLFPGGFWQSNILSSSICASVTTQACSAPLAGLYDSSKSSTTSSLSETGSVDNSTFADKGVLSLYGSGKYVFDAMSIVTEDPPSAQVDFENFDMLVISEGSWTLPGGTKYSIEVGNLALGAPEVNQSWTNGSQRFNSSLVPASLYLEGQVPSNSFGLHIGSTAMSIPPSLYIGGYDQSRVLGEVTVQDFNMHYFPLDLLDIGLGAASGPSLFPATTASGLLARGNSSVGVSTQVIIDPVAPYLYLPSSTCNAIAQNLPVTYNSNLGLYFWDTSDARYQQIISSSSYLSFTFRLNSSITQNMTINVPFSLLNLTLTSPLVSSPTQYFPCTPFDTGKSYGLYTLGKAFLQAAFLGVNWQLEGKGSWFLAQAPGPNTPSQAVVKTIGLNDAFITPSTNNWADTWRGTWPAETGTTPGNSSSVDGGSSGKASGLSKAAIGGIAAVGAGVGVIAISCVVIFWRRKASKAAVEEEQIRYERPELDVGMQKTPLIELSNNHSMPRLELESRQQRMELEG